MEDWAKDSRVKAEENICPGKQGAIIPDLECLSLDFFFYKKIN